MSCWRDCIFDLYGTLVDIHTDETSPGLWEAMTEHYRRWGALYAPKELHAAYRRIIREMEWDAAPIRRDVHETHPEIQIEFVFYRLYREKGVDAGLDQAVETGRTFRRLSTKFLRLYDGARELLEALRVNRQRVWLLSNAQGIFTRDELDRLGVTGLFDGIYLSSDYGVKKPDRRFFEILLHEQSIDPAEAVMVGNDGVCDIAGAKAVGLATVYIRSSLSPIEPLPKADFMLEEMDFAQVRSILLSTPIRSQKNLL